MLSLLELAWAALGGGVRWGVLTGVQALDDGGGIDEVPSADHTHEMGVQLGDFDAGGAVHFVARGGSPETHTHRRRVDARKERGGGSRARKNPALSPPLLWGGRTIGNVTGGGEEAARQAGKDLHAAGRGCLLGGHPPTLGAGTGCCCPMPTCPLPPPWHSRPALRMRPSAAGGLLRAPLPGGPRTPVASAKAGGGAVGGGAGGGETAPNPGAAAETALGISGSEKGRGQRRWL